MYRIYRKCIYIVDIVRETENNYVTKKGNYIPKKTKRISFDLKDFFPEMTRILKSKRTQTILMYEAASKQLLALNAASDMMEEGSVNEDVLKQMLVDGRVLVGGTYW